MRTPDYYLTTVLEDTKKTGSHCGAMVPRFALFPLCICAKPLKPLGHQGFSVDGLITPTLKAAGSNPVGRTKNSRKLNIYESFFTCKVQNLSYRFDYYFVQNYFLLHYLFFLEEHIHRRSRWLSLSGRSPKWYIQVRDALLDDECTKESEEVLDDLEITFLNQ